MESISTDGSLLFESVDCDDRVLERFAPVPYIFTVKDAHGRPIILPPGKVNNVKVQCPDFHILLDHLIAVLWCFYSDDGLEKLGTAQVHWAINILEGTKDRNNSHTDDVAMAIGHLENFLFDLYNNIEEETLENRDYTELSDDFTTIRKRGDIQSFDDDVGTYEDFAANFEDASMAAHNISITLDDMLSNNLQQFNQLMEKSDIQTLYVREGDRAVLSDTSNKDYSQYPESGRSKSVSKTKIQPPPNEQGEQHRNIIAEVVKWRTDKIEKLIKQLELIKYIDDSIKPLQCKDDGEIEEQLDKLLNMPE